MSSLVHSKHRRRNFCYCFVYVVETLWKGLFRNAKVHSPIILFETMNNKNTFEWLGLYSAYNNIMCVVVSFITIYDFGCCSVCGVLSVMLCGVYNRKCRIYRNPFNTNSWSLSSASSSVIVPEKEKKQDKRRTKNLFGFSHIFGALHHPVSMELLHETHRSRWKSRFKSKSKKQKKRFVCFVFGVWQNKNFDFWKKERKKLLKKKKKK